MYKLFWSKASGAFAPEALLVEAGADYQRVRVDMKAGAQREPAYLKVNPLGRIPALQLEDGTVVTESAALCLQIADDHPDAALVPPPGSAQRASVYRWLVYGACEIYESDLHHAYPQRYTTDPEGGPAVQASAIARWDHHWDIVEDALGSGPYLLGDRFCAVDPYFAMLVAWHHDIEGLLKRCPKLNRLVQTTRKRPSLAGLWHEHFNHKPSILTD